MKNILLPDYYVQNLAAIPLTSLYRQGYRAMVVDLDNTLTHWNDNQISPEVKNWQEKAAELGFRICLVSNNHSDRVRRVALELGLPWVCDAGKPRRKAFFQAMEKLGVKPAQTAVVGDQIFTDVLGGNRAGLYTILVVPLSSHEFIGTRVIRLAERLVLRRLTPSG